jgi:hypothetical protein
MKALAGPARLRAASGAGAVAAIRAAGWQVRRRRAAYDASVCDDWRIFIVL